MPLPSLSLLGPWGCGDTSTHPPGTFMERRQTPVWKALLTVMHVRFIRRLQGNGGGGRVPNTARAFIFDITKRSLARGQAGVYGNIKCRHVLSVGGAPGERQATQPDSTSLPWDAQLLRRASQAWRFRAGSLVAMRWDEEEPCHAAGPLFPRLKRGWLCQPCILGVTAFCSEPCTPQEHQAAEARPCRN